MLEFGYGGGLINRRSEEFQPHPFLTTQNRFDGIVVGVAVVVGVAQSPAERFLGCEFVELPSLKIVGGLGIKNVLYMTKVFNTTIRLLLSWQIAMSIAAVVKVLISLIPNAQTVI